MAAEAIAEITDGKFKLNIGNLTAVLHNLKCQDLAIVSMAGAYRTGKSFMLNFFIRYLRNEGWENKNWFGPEDMKIQDDFEWRDGSNPHTLGIFVWPEIFYVEKDGKQVGVLIVNTQGLFDDRSSPDTNINIMAISTLLSSHQILNFLRNVRGTDLEHLQLALEYALAASHKFQMKDKSFQKLTFLVRDWPLPREHEFGHGGDAYVNQVLKETDSNQPESVTQVKKSIYQGFEHVNGFLMSKPRPINGWKSSRDIRNSDITGKFRDHIITLADSILNPKNLVVKKMFGQPISANGLINLISEFSNWIQSGKQPKIETCLEGTIKANNATALQDAVTKYRCSLKELIGSSFPSEEELHGHHKNALREAEKVFRSMARLGSESKNENVWNRVKEECEMYNENMEEEFRLRKVAKIEKLRIKSEEVEKEYENKMNKLLTNVSLKILEVKHMQYYHEALHEYERYTIGSEALAQDGDYIIEQLKTRMRAFFKQLKQQREILENKKQIAKEKEQFEMQKAARDYSNDQQQKMAKELSIKSLQISKEMGRNDFIQKMKPYENTYEENFQTICRGKMLEVLEEFDEETKDLDSLEEKILEARIDLEKTIQEVLNRGIQRNNENRELNGTRVGDAVQAIVLKYRGALNELMLKAYVETGGFEVVEQRYIEEIDAQVGNEAIKELIKEEIRKETEKAKSKNEKDKDYKSVTADENTVANYLAIGVITITFPVWVPLGLIGLVVAGVVSGVVKLKDFIKSKMRSRK
uniref:atlastin-3-like n=1 Tax=Styela clava TaxID=7725 RepID=UPI00193A33C4|nr:atlastin-3-like [Styela clava]